MPELYRTIVTPVVTEKSSEAYSTRLEYTFRTDRDATKQEIRQAIERLFEVTVVDVRTMLMPAKLRRRGRTRGRRPRWKKAIVTLKQGDKIEIFEG